MFKHNALSRWGLLITVLLLLFLQSTPHSQAASLLKEPQTYEFTESDSKSNWITFLTTGYMNVVRAYHTDTLLDNGKVLVTGGYEIGGGRLANAELYDPAIGTWSNTGSMNTVRQWHTATLLNNGKVLVVGGNNSSSLASTELYDPLTGIWNLTGNMTLGRDSHTATLLENGKVLVVGGRKDGAALASVELYDPSTGIWSTTGSLNHARYRHTATMLNNGNVLVAGGYNGDPINSAELFDPILGTWKTTGNLEDARMYHTSTLLENGKVLVVGGNDGIDLNLSSTELYDPITGLWSFTSNMNIARSFHTTTLLKNGLVLVTGGYDDGNLPALSSVELYNQDTDKWSIAGSMNIGRLLHTTTLLMNDSILLAGGSSGGNTTLDSAEIGTFAADNTPPSASSLSINSGALSTTAINVTLSFIATDDMSGVAQMSFSNDGETWGNWVPYSNITVWKLTSGDEEKIVYARATDMAGNISNVISNTIKLDTDAGSVYGFTINNGAVFTNQIDVLLTIGAQPGTERMMVSNDGGFYGAQWEPYDSRRAWSITQYGSYVIPRTVYVRYGDTNGNVLNTSQDDIILDVTPPTGSVNISPITQSISALLPEKFYLLPFQSTNGIFTIFLPNVMNNYCWMETGPANVTLQLQSQDDVSGVGYMMISNLSTFDCAKWEAYLTTKPFYMPSGSTTVYVKYRDNAGNISSVITGTR